MPYLSIDDFRSGLDTRKSNLTAPPGSLLRLVNAAVSPGGEIQKRRAFVKVATLTNTTGLAAIGNKVVAFTRNQDLTPPSLGMTTASLEYHKLPLTSTTARMIDFDVFDGNIYTTFFDQNPPTPTPANSGATLPTGIPQKAVWRVTSTGKKYQWLSNRWVLWTEKYIGAPPTQPLVKGVTFKNETNGGNWEYNGTAWAQLIPTFSGNGNPDSSKAPSPTTGNTYLDYASQKLWRYNGTAWVAWAPTYIGATFPASPALNDTFLDTSNSTTYKYNGTAWVAFTFDGTVTSTLPTGVKQNELFKLTTTNVVYAWRGDAWVVWTPLPDDYNPHFYYDAATGEDYTPANAYVKTEGSGRGYYVRSYQSKVYTLNDKYIYFSAIKYPKLWDDAASLPPSGATVVSVLPVTGTEGERVILPAKKKIYTWTIGSTGVGNWIASDPDAADILWITESTQRTGSGFINTALQESGGKGLQGIDIYYDKLAVFSPETTQLWAMDPDPNQNALSQVLRGNGTLAPKSVQQYGSGDVLYLASSGIRSLKARDASNSAAVTDIGSPVDAFVRNLGITNGRTYLANCQAINEPVVGRFWAVFPTEILVLSYFPGPRITAWSVYTVPFVIDYIVTAGEHIFIRSGNDLYLFGGTTGEEYDNCGVEVRFPYLDAGKPGHMKMFEALDATVEGSWRAAVSYDFNNPAAEEQLGTLTAPTWNMGRFALQGYSSHISMRFYNENAAPATLANAAIHFHMGDDT